ncbi:MAG TPA: efflux RND transporter permease subunit [Desulfurella acetivorans]|nr:efflux RND transporter permease subunit [Desulfurella acetivorans]
MKFQELLWRKKKAIIFLIIVIVFGGIFATFKTPVALFPNVEFPRIRVTVDSGDIPASTMAIEVTKKVEQTLRAVPDVVHIRSTTSRGSAEFILDFGWGQNMNVNLLNVESALNGILPTLPKGTTFHAIRMYPTVYPAIAYSLTSDNHSLVELRDIALYEIKPLLLNIKGVANVQVQGGEKEEYHVLVNPMKLYTYNLTMSDVIKSLSNSNVISAVGRLEDYYKLYLVVSKSQLHNMQSIEDTVLKTSSNGIVRLSDIATIKKSIVPNWTKVVANGKNAVIVQIIQSPQGNTVQIAHDVDKKLHEFKSKLPSGIKIAKWYDQSKLIVSSTHSLRDAIIIGIILSIIVVLVFLNNFKITVTLLISLPTILFTTILLIYVFKMSFNIMTLGGIAAAVGLIIDDVIVMIEYIMRFVEEHKNEDISKVIPLAVKDFLKPLLGSSLSTTVIFIPFAFLSGVTGAFFKTLSITMAMSLIISFLVTVILVPIIARKLLNRGIGKEKKNIIVDFLAKLYKNAINFSFRKPIIIYLLVLILVICGIYSFKNIGSGFMPSMDEGGFVLDYVTKPGTSLNETQYTLSKIENIIQSNKYVQNYTARTGLQLGGGLTEPNTGDFFIKLKPFPRPSVQKIMDEIRNKIETTVPGVNIDMAQLMEDMIGDLVGTPSPIEIKIYSDNYSQLLSIAPKVANIISKVPGVVDVKSGVVLAGDALNIEINRSKAAIEGVDPNYITQQLNQYLNGIDATNILESPRIIGVRVWTTQNFRKNITDIENFPIRTQDGKLIPLKRIANLQIVSGQPEIVHDNLKNMIAVTARISNTSLGQAVSQVKQDLNKSQILNVKGVYYEFGGLYAQQKKAFAGLFIVLVSAVVLVFVVLLFMYEEFSLAILILLMSLLALAADFIGLYITKTQLNITSIMGLIMSVGINTETAIFYISEYKEFIETKNNVGAIINAGKNRMRPIVMSTLIAILSLMPIAINLGHGSDMLKPLAIAIISGLFAQLFMVLFVLPTALLGLEKLKNK